jgi:hypothetical protein
VLSDATQLDLNRPRSIGEILAMSLRLYGRLPLLFLFLAGIVVVPYEVVVVLLQHGKGGVAVGTELILALVELALIDPCIAAVQVQALLDLGDGRAPQIQDVIRRGLAVLPVVAAAEIIAGIGIAAGVLFFIIPGVILALRWAVVAQVAAVEHTDWPTALRRSAVLARRNYWRILAILATVGILNQIPGDVIGAGTRLGSTIVGVALAIVVHSFGTLMISLLYFDLRARESAPVA